MNLEAPSDGTPAGRLPQARRPKTPARPPVRHQGPSARPGGELSSRGGRVRTGETGCVESSKTHPTGTITSTIPRLASSPHREGSRTARPRRRAHLARCVTIMPPNLAVFREKTQLLDRLLVSRPAKVREVGCVELSKKHPRWPKFFAEWCVFATSTTRISRRISHDRRINLG